jgi:hypothetical protein
MKRLKVLDKISISMLSILILIYSIVLQFSIPSFVLCFGDDGHIAFEQSEHDFQCVGLDDHEDQLMDNHKNLSHQNDDCEDIPLLNILSTPFLEKDGKSKNVKLTLIDTKNKTINTYLVLRFDINKDSTIIHSSIKSLQATVLLI